MFNVPQTGRAYFVLWGQKLEFPHYINAEDLFFSKPDKIFLLRW